MKKMDLCGIFTEVVSLHVDIAVVNKLMSRNGMLKGLPYVVTERIKELMPNTSKRNCV